jgi:hypothetical protein
MEPILCKVCGNPSAVFVVIDGTNHRLAKTMIRLVGSSGKEYVHEFPCHEELNKGKNETKQDNT